MIKTNYKLTKNCCIIALVFISSAVFAQDQTKMEQLNFMVGEWVGTSKMYENGVVTKEGPAYEKISFDLNHNIIVIELNSEFLQLHTVIRYDKEEQCYFYHPFSKRGTGEYRADFRDGKLVVFPNDTARYIFTTIESGGFQEYGERLIDGGWVVYFEDTFRNTQ